MTKGKLSWLFILVGLLQWKTDRWWPQWVGVCVSCSILMLPFLKEKLGSLLTLAFSYVCIHFAFFTLTATRFKFFEDFKREADRVILRTQGFEFFTYALLFTMVVLFQFSHHRINVRHFFARMYYAVLITTGITYAFGYGYEGYLGNWGMNVCFLVCLTPFVPRYMWFISGMLVVLSDASTAYAVFAVVVLSEWRAQLRMVIPGLICAALFAAYIHPILLNDSERFINWKLYIEYWWNNSRLFGFGPGTFGPIGPMLQLRSGQDGTNALLWAHNEYIQVCFEYGLVGFCLFISVCISLIRKSTGALVPFQSLLYGALACAVTDYPFRLALFMFIIVLTISEILYGSQKRSMGT